MVVLVLVLAGVAVLGAVVVLAMGRGGELAETHPDYPRLPLGAAGRPITGPDVAHMRFPRTFWGYQPQVMDEALRRVSNALSERDARVALLEQQLHDLRHGAGSIGALHGLEEPPPNGALDETAPNGALEEPAPSGTLEEPVSNGAPPSLAKDDTDEERVSGAKEDRP
ncbi:hypothetical protein E1287_06845 [Actinomadura sp. KC06]|uniref:hypothetical protein n=1 Tax=Actinomadura sp. KC06 TaxID=2530369 RepID=UPI001043E631|nr:hypothetical protein [Actinomadura sp. KC06]TDD38012.1 hypothetical protein E1287_06845 [Actinomadura sp. KC06]